MSHPPDVLHGLPVHKVATQDVSQAYCDDIRDAVESISIGQFTVYPMVHELDDGGYAVSLLIVEEK